MPEIRAFSEDDLPAVLDLLAGRIEGWDADAGFLRATLLDHPQADPAFPSLVALDSDGSLLGFIGSQPRKLRVGVSPVESARQPIVRAPADLLALKRQRAACPMIKNCRPRPIVRHERHADQQPRPI